MLEYIQFCVVDFWFEFNCIKNSLQKNALETKMEKERIKRKDKTPPSPRSPTPSPLGLLAQLPLPPRRPAARAWAPSPHRGPASSRPR